jgi:iron complex outermembrane receptor protein
MTATRDTSAHVLHEVVVSGYTPPAPLPAEQYSVGTHVLHFNRAALIPVQHLSLSDYLQTHTAIHLREYGKGMQSSISLRGTAASHTAVRWNGFDVNIPTMSAGDFSRLPLFFFDEVKVHAGGESVLYGNGAIGGSVELLTMPDFNGSLHAHVRQTVGSYGYTFTGGALRWSGKRWESRTSVMHTQATNHYTYTNTLRNGRLDTLKNAAYRNWGALQEVYYRAGSHHLLSARIWYMDFYREIQPPVTWADNVKYDDIYDRNFRALVNYSGKAGILTLNAQAGYAYDYERFHADIIASGKWLQAAEAEYAHRKFTVKLGVNSEYIKPDVYSYFGDITEWRTDVFVQARWTPSARWTLSGGVRQSFVTGVQTPPTPSAGASYILWKQGFHELKIHAAASRNIKIPSLNDRYWGGGNVSLSPETGLEGETGLGYRYTPPAWTVNVTANTYYNRISDWIRWLPSSPIGSQQNGMIWRPKNVGVVDCYGAELLWQAQRKWWKTALDISASYAYTPAVMRKGARAGDTGVGQQAAYQPLHVAHIAVKPSYGRAFVQAGFRYVGERHTTDIFDILAPYMLTDVSGGYTFLLSKIFISALLQVNNMFDADYQNMKNYAMPGRNYNVTLRINF